MDIIICPKCGSEIEKSSYRGFEIEKCISCGYRNIIESKKLCTDYEGKCGNCHKNLGNNDQYCRYCGTKRGEGEFKPYENVSYCIYGPAPRLRLHSCKSCGYEWNTHSMVASERYCPKCGTICQIVEKNEDFDLEVPDWVINMGKDKEKSENE